MSSPSTATTSSAASGWTSTSAISCAPPGAFWPPSSRFCSSTHCGQPGCARQWTRTMCSWQNRSSGVGRTITGRPSTCSTRRCGRSTSRCRCCWRPTRTGPWAAAPRSRCPPCGTRCGAFTRLQRRTPRLPSNRCAHPRFRWCCARSTCPTSRSRPTGDGSDGCWVESR